MADIRRKFREEKLKYRYSNRWMRPIFINITKNNIFVQEKPVEPKFKAQEKQKSQLITYKVRDHIKN